MRTYFLLLHADWRASDWAGREDEYTYVFTANDISELTAAVDALKARGVKTEDDVIAVSALRKS